MPPHRNGRRCYWRWPRPAQSRHRHLRDASRWAPGLRSCKRSRRPSPTGSRYTGWLASDSGLHYIWILEEVHQNGDTLREEFRYLEAWATWSTRSLRFFHDAKAPEAHPGYTMHALSRATYRRLRHGQPDSLQIIYVDGPPGSAQLRSPGFGGGG